MKKIAIKLAVFCITLMCISSVLAFLISTFYTHDIREEMRLYQRSIATTILELDQKTELTIEEIVNITSTSMYDVQKVESLDELEITPEEMKRVNNNEIVYLSQKRFQATTVLLLDNNYIRINLHPHNTLYKIMVSRLWLNLSSYIVIGTLLVILLVKRAVKPIIRLNWAIQEVTKGNFAIQIENKSKDEVGNITKNFNKMVKELRNIEYLRKDFITNVSHEFKTPIASIQGFAKLLQKDNLSDEERQEYTDIIVEETTRLANLSANILKLSKIENQEIPEKKGLFSLDEQIRKSILLLEHKWSLKDIQFNIDLEKAMYLGDEELLQQVWINLLDNAVKFSKHSGDVAISLKQKASAIVVQISDYGIGMDEETSMRIFEKFYQGDKARSYEGNGLGLALVKRIIDLHGGKISVESSIQEGSIFTLELPLE